jgi:hypothetical protein
VARLSIPSCQIPSTRKREATHQILPRLLLVILRLQLVYLQEPLEPTPILPLALTKQNIEKHSRQTPLIRDIQKLNQLVLGLLAERRPIGVPRPLVQRFGAEERVGRWGEQAAFARRGGEELETRRTVLGEYVF